MNVKVISVSVMRSLSLKAYSLPLFSGIEYDEIGIALEVEAYGLTDLEGLRHGRHLEIHGIHRSKCLRQPPASNVKANTGRSILFVFFIFITY